jgi:hypothetical protein
MTTDLADPVTEPAARAPQSGASYQRLMSLTLRHEFYGGAPCTDFAIAPTAPTQALMSSLGLIARPRRGGIDIIYHTGRCAGIVRFLHEERRLRQDARTKHAGDRETSYKGSWTRLTFTLSLTNDLFANFTAIPLPMPHMMGAGAYALYLSNRFVKPPDAKQPGRPAQLYSEWARHWRRLPPAIFSPEHLHIATPPDAAEFVLYSTSGRALLRADPDYLPPVSPPGDKRFELPARVRLNPGLDVHVSMANETPGLFSHEVKGINKSHETVESRLTEFFYSGTRTAPLLLADLFLASPEADDPNAGSYPIELPEQLPNNMTSAAANAEAQRRITPLDYEFSFGARETTWIYYVVLPSGEAAVAGLAIEADPKDALEFHPPEQVKLPTGAWAHRFVARKAMPLQRRSNIALRLRAGGGPGNGSARILLDRLPTPSAERITARPAGRPLTDASAASEVFVYL